MTDIYAELHARSAFSFLEGASQPEDLIEEAARFEFPAMALLDRDCISGAVHFHNAAKKTKTRALVGAEVTAKEGFRYPLIAETRLGYQNLCRLLSKIKLREANGSQHKAAATVEDITEHSAGLICLTGGEEGPLAFALRSGDDPARQRLAQLKHIFGEENVFVEMQRHHLRDEERRNQAAVSLAGYFHLSLLATNGVCHATEANRPLMDVLTCTRHKTTIAEAGRLLAQNSERHVKSAPQMRRLFADYPKAISNTHELATRIAYTLANLGYEFPEYPTPHGEPMSVFLRKLTEAKAPNRFQEYGETVTRQLTRELDLIEKLNLAGYFLIVWDIVEFCRNNNILVQGRGSAANSAVCYALGITAIDPVKMKLLFERFLSENRGEWPDIDLDLPSSDQRERAIQHLYDKYGKYGAAMTANVISYRERSAGRDIGKALGFDPATLSRLSALVPQWGYQDHNDTAERQFRNADIDVRHPRVRQFLALYKGIQDLPRHLGQHSGGMVLCRGRLDSVVPLQPATMPDRVIVQWDKEDCADMGIIKVDLLGLGMMAVLGDTIELIGNHYGKTLGLADLPEDDPAVYKTLQRADTIGLFQVESRAQMSCLPQLKPNKFYDLVVEVAIIRPGPIVGDMYHPYLRRKHGLEPADAMHPSLDEVLKRTLGVPLFQEQLLRVAMISANFSGSEAEELRRAFGFKRSEKRMKEIEGRLRDGMTRNGITGDTQNRIVQSITSFAMYGFPESHAASFALLAYASAYYKQYYLAAFTAAMLNNQPMGFYSAATLVKDAQHHGLHFKPVDVTRSEWKCTIEGDGSRYSLRLGLNYVRGLSEETGQAMVAARPFTGVRDLVRRVPSLRRAGLSALAACGALNALPGVKHRRDALWEAELAIRPVGEMLDPAAPESPSCPLRAMNDGERLLADFTNTSLTIGRHPMSFHREQLNRMGVVPAAMIREMRHGSLVSVAGAVICRQRPGTAKGFVFLSLEDETGVVNVIVHPKLFEQNRAAWVKHAYLRVDGLLQHQRDAISLKASRAIAIDSPFPSMISYDFH